MNRKRTTTSRRSLSAISRTIRTAEIINFTINELPKIMEVLKVDAANYAIGGSVAGIMYGIDFNRIPHDIDIIVPQGFIDLIQLRVEYSPLFIQSDMTSSTDAEFKIKNFAFKTITGYIIDIIEYDKFYDENSKVTFISKPNVMSLATLIETKQKYNCSYDRDDLDALCTKADTMGIEYTIVNASGSDNDIDENQVTTNEPISDFDALAELKAKMEENSHE